MSPFGDVQSLDHDDAERNSPYVCMYLPELVSIVLITVSPINQNYPLLFSIRGSVKDRILMRLSDELSQIYSFSNYCVMHE